MKKQNNEGFALAYVMIVVTVLNLIAVALMSMSFRVFQAEQASIQRMQAKYEAQGEIERIVAELSSVEQYSDEVCKVQETDYVSADTKEEALAAAQQKKSDVGKAAKAKFMDEIEDELIEKFGDDNIASITEETLSASVIVRKESAYQKEEIDDESAKETVFKVEAEIMIYPSISVTYNVGTPEINSSTGKFDCAVECIYEMTDVFVEFMTYEVSTVENTVSIIDAEGGEV